MAITLHGISLPDKTLELTADGKLDIEKSLRRLEDDPLKLRYFLRNEFCRTIIESKNWGRLEYASNFSLVTPKVNAPNIRLHENNELKGLIFLRFDSGARRQPYFQYHCMLCNSRLQVHNSKLDTIRKCLNSECQT